MTPDVSIIMPALNMAPWIGESIDSVIAQTTRTWELLVVDDGSEDGTSDIVASRAASDPRVRLLRHPDGRTHGASASRNLGLRESRARFVALLDADDIWLAMKLEEQLRIMTATANADFLYGRTTWWYSWNTEADVTGDQRADYTPPLRVRFTRGQPMAGHVLLELFLRQAAEMPSTCSVLFRRELAVQVGGFEEAFRTVHTDQAFFAKLLLRGSALGVDRAWDKYRQRPGSSSTLDAASAIEARRQFLTWLADYLQAQEMHALPVMDTVRRELRWMQAPPALRRIRRFANRLPGRLAGVAERVQRVLGRDERRAAGPT